MKRVVDRPLPAPFFPAASKKSFFCYLRAIFRLFKTIHEFFAKQNKFAKPGGTAVIA